MTIETQKERIERLTKLARKAFQDDGAVVRIDMPMQSNEVLLGEDEDGYRDMAVRISMHPRALDALEATLIVLSSKEGMVLTPAEPGVDDVLDDAEDDENAAPTVRYDSNRPPPGAEP